MTRAAGALDLRPARAQDAARLAELSTGHIAGKDEFINESLGRRDVIVAYVGDTIAGYAIWDRAFFGRPFLWLLGVDPAFRRCGLGRALVEAFLASCASDSAFTSTNESNAAMHALLRASGFAISGRLENLDPGDPEIFYVLPAGSRAPA